MSYEGLLHRGVASFGSSSSTPLTHSTISEDSLQVPSTLYIHNVTVDQKAVRGSGSFGTVFVANWHNSKVAAKKLHEIFFDQLSTVDSKTGILRSFAREVNMLIQLKHPNVVQFYGLYTTRSGHDLNPDTYLVQELMHCALDIRLRQSPPLTFRNVVDIALDVASGLRYLHERVEPIIHRDLASKNILLSLAGVAKIADLGVAKILDEHRGTPQSRLPGTELYMPPEVKIEGMLYDTRVDIYSFGVVLLEISIGRDAKANETFRVSASNSIVLTPETERRKEDFDSLGHHPLRPVILSCLTRREDRPTAKRVSDQLKDFCAKPVYQNCPNIPVILPPPERKRSDSFDRQYLEERLQNLQREKEHLQAKLSSQRQHTSEYQLDQLMSENVSLQSLLAKKDAQISQLNNVLKHKQKEDSGLEKQAANLREENKYLRQKLQEGGPMSLPEKLPSFTSENEPSLRSDVSLSADQLPTLQSLSISSSEPQESLEVAKLKKKLEKYMSVNVEMDQKLKEARLQLQKYNGRAELSYKLELDQVRAECRQLQSQLDISLRENSYLQSQLSAALSRRY